MTRWMYSLRLRIRSILRRARVEQELDDELSFHLAMQARAAKEAGISQTEAFRRAGHDFAGLQQTKERCRDAWPLRWADDLLHDVRYAARGLRRTPGFTLVAVTALALGIGANTALFGVISAVLLRPLPYADANRLARVWTAFSNGVPGDGRGGSALPDYRTWRAENHSFDEMGASHGVTYNLTGVDRPERLVGTRVTASMWALLRPKPLLGTVFPPDAEQWGHHRVVVLGEGLWRRRFGADPTVVGRTVQLNGQLFTIVGVLPTSFQYPGPRTELWTPISYAPGDAMDTRANHFVDVLGRLKAGVTLTQAQADLAVIAARVRQQVPENAGVDVTMLGWREAIVGDVRPTLMLLLGAVAVVLLIACTNVANLVLARAMARQQELTVRVALGAGRGRLVRQLLAENILLSSIGATAGLGLAYLLVRALSAAGPTGLPRLREVALDGVVVAFAAGLALVTGLGFGVWPARHIGHLDVAGDLKESARTASGGRGQTRARSLLLVAEVSLSVVLLIGASLLIVSLVRLQQVDPGFRPDHVLTASVSLPPIRYRDPDRIAAFVLQASENIAALPGVQAAAGATSVPLSGIGWGKYFSIDGRPIPPSLAQVPLVEYRQITPRYFHTMGATLRQGRAFTPEDVPEQPAVAIVNETLARRFWPSEDPLGARVSVAPPESLVASLLPRNFPGFPRMTIVGIVEDLRENGLDRETSPEVYVPFAQARPPHEDASDSFFLVVRTATEPLSYQRSIEAVVHDLDANLPIASVRTLDSSLSESLAQRRFAMLLLSGLAGVALVLVIAGIYGVMAYVVSQRRHELGIRAALGATRRDLTSLVLSQGLRVTAVGTLIGLTLAASLSQFVSRQLFEVRPVDPAIYAGTALLMLIVAVLACGIPALRAAWLDPITILRHD